MAFVKISEQPSLYNDLEKKSVREILEDINTEDQKVALAVQKAIPQIEKLVTQIVPRMKQGGRIFYMGAGTSGRLGVLDASEIPPTFGMPPTLVIGLIAGGDTALRNPVENAEDDMRRGWEELVDVTLRIKIPSSALLLPARLLTLSAPCRKHVSTAFLQAASPATPTLRWQQKQMFPSK